MSTQTAFSSSPEETFLFGLNLGRSLPPSSVVAFFGDLGAGKTTLIKGLVEGATAISHSEVHSPTFTYLQIYEGQKPVYHFDLYRLKSASEFLAMGFDEYFFSSGICCIEWSERIEDDLPKGAIKIKLSHQGENKRLIEVLA